MVLNKIANILPPCSLHLLGGGVTVNKHNVMKCYEKQGKWTEREWGAVLPEVSGKFLKK